VKNREIRRKERKKQRRQGKEGGNRKEIHKGGTKYTCNLRKSNNDGKLIQIGL
jgi:hypothetical protein